MRKSKKVLQFLESENLINSIILLGIFWFLISYFKVEHLFSLTTTSGGDTASHYYPAYYLKNYLLTKVKIVGWDQGWYGGMPMFHFYFPITFILIALLSFVIPLQISFKLITVLGIFLLPIATFFTMKILKFKFPVPILAAIFTLPFLFNQGNSMWGGNIPSTLAGEFSYSFSLSLMVLFFGLLYKGIERQKYHLRNAITFALIVFSHVYTMLVIGLASLFFLTTRKNFLRNFLYIVVVFGLGFMLIAFWFLPLVAKLEWTSPFIFNWQYSDARKEIFPDILLPFYIFAFYGVYIGFKNKDKRISFLLMPALLAIPLYFLSPQLGVVDIRFVPFLQLFPLLVAAYGLGELLKTKLRIRFLPLLIFIIVIVWIENNASYIGSWIEWNYSGFESKQLWPSYNAVNNFLKGSQDDPRVVFEHSEQHNSAGTPRAFESLPLFSGRSNLEGLYMQGIQTSPFMFYVQSVISDEKSCPFPEWHCTDLNSTKAAKYLEMFNVKHIIARSDKLKRDLSSNFLYVKVATFDPYEIYELKSNDGHYVTVPKYEPILFETKEWKKLSYYEWFQNEDLLDIPLVFTKDAQKEAEEFKNVIKDGKVDGLPKVSIDGNCDVRETILQEEILFTTNCVGKPHIIRISYFPNWQVEGAERVYLVSPSFMLVFPQRENVRLFYDDIWTEHLGKILTYVGLLTIALVIFSRNQKLKSLLPRWTTS